MEQPPPPKPAPGMYPDPDDPLRQRFWNGNGWAPPAASESPAPAPQSHRSIPSWVWVVGVSSIALATVGAVLGTLLVDESDDSPSARSSNSSSNALHACANKFETVTRGDVFVEESAHVERGRTGAGRDAWFVYGESHLLGGGSIRVECTIDPGNMNVIYIFSPDIGEIYKEG